MLVHGEHVKICATNPSDWTARLREQLISTLQNPADSDHEESIRQAVAIVNQIRVGFDVNGDEKLIPSPAKAAR